MTRKEWVHKISKIVEGSTVLTKEHSEILREIVIRNFRSNMGFVGYECVLVLDFEGIEDVTCSFVSNFLMLSVKMCKKNLCSYCIVKNANLEIEAAIDSVLKNNSISVLSTSFRGTIALGSCGKVLKPILDMILITKGKVDSKYISDKLGLTISLTNNRLNKLVSLGLIMKEPSVRLEGDRGGQKCLYQSIMMK